MTRAVKLRRNTLRCWGVVDIQIGTQECLAIHVFSWVHKIDGIYLNFSRKWETTRMSEIGDNGASIMKLFGFACIPASDVWLTSLYIIQNTYLKTQWRYPKVRMWPIENGCRIYWKVSQWQESFLLLINLAALSLSQDYERTEGNSLSSCQQGKNHFQQSIRKRFVDGRDGYGRHHHRTEELSSQVFADSCFHTSL